METVEEFQAVRDSVSSDIWFGGIYNSTEGKYQWVGSEVNANVSQMYFSYPPTYDNDYRIMYNKASKKITAISKTVSVGASLCEEY